MNLFKLTFGDWGADGHCQCYDSIVTSEVPFERVQRAYDQIPKKTGIDVEQICSDFDETQIPEEVWLKLQEMGYCEFDGDCDVSKSELADIIVFLLNSVDPELHLEIVDAPVLYSSAGYGLFDE